MTAMRHLLRILLAGAVTLAASAQPDATAKVRIRAVLHDPMKPFAEMYVRSAAGALVRLNLAMEGLTEPQLVTVSKGFLQLYSSATIDAAKPQANLLASVSIADGVKQAIIFIVPAGEKEKLPYKLMVLNDSVAAFAKGESRVINMTQLPLAIKAGEHAKEVPPARIVAVPPVTKVNALNQAQTLFYRKVDQDWILLSERPMQYTATLRNIFLMYLMPNVDEPQIRTLIDTSTPQ
ncbi:MAG: hypothetical protein NTW21_33230 [Verrucomicrobia bacterium]|nr:hypothetical protein [Verrucomicrobiota bacterium]